MTKNLKHRIKRHHLSVRPMVVCCGTPTQLTISALSDHARFIPDEIIHVSVLPMNDRPYIMEDEYVDPSFPVKASNDGTLSLTVNCVHEQEYAIRLFYDTVDKGRQNYCTLSIFSAKEDLYARRPYKGDTHIHTVDSGGQESPGVVAATYRRAGFDFIAITDHHTYEPSLEAIECLKDLPADISIFPGEEVHVPEEFIHAINFGGCLCVNQYYHETKEKVDKEIKSLMTVLDVACPDKREYACRLWVAQRIHEGGGLAIYAHSHRITLDVCTVSDAMSEYVYEKGDYDAVELLSGRDTFSNNMQTAFYFDQMTKGRRIPIVGASDSHGTWGNNRHFDEQYSVIFAPDRTFNGIKESIKNYYSVAVKDNHDDQFWVYGDYRMVRYAIFLVREYFPLYKRLCIEQGECLIRYLQGNKEEFSLLKLLEGRTDRFYEEYFGRNI